MIPNHPGWSDLKTASELDAVTQGISVDSIPIPRSVSIGPEILSQSNGKVNVRNHVAYFSSGSLFIRSSNTAGDDWTAPTLLGSITEVPNTLNLAFDQLGRPQIFYEANNEIRLYGYDTTSQTVTSIFICNGTTPVAAMDYPNDTSRASCDIVLAYVLNNQVKFRQQRDKYEVVYPVMDVSPGDELMLIDCGFRKDRRFGINYRYKPVVVVPGEVYPPYVVGTWRFRNQGNSLSTWADQEVDPRSTGVVWDNGEAQISIILSSNVDGNIPGVTTLVDHHWSTELPNQPSWGPYAWVGIGFGQYSGLSPADQGFADFYDVTLEIASGGNSFKFAVKFSTDQWYPGYDIYLIDPDTGVIASTPTAPILIGGWHNLIDESMLIESAPGATPVLIGDVIERWSLSIWVSEIANTWFPGTFGDYQGIPQLGEFELTMRAVNIAGTAPDLVGYMKFTTTGAP